MDISDQNRIRNYFNNSLADDESYLASKFLVDENEQELKEIMQQQWEASPSPDLDLQHILNRIHFTINNSNDKQPLLNRLWLGYARIAAVLLLPLLLSVVYLMEQKSTVTGYAEIRAAEGSRVQFTLPDGSVGYLNGGSRLSYLTNFSKNRKVTLEGEGYFDVQKDPAHPFTVQTAVADIEVFGTRFDVCSYSSDQEVRTTLEEGSVRVYNKKNNAFLMLAPGEQSVIDRENGDMRKMPVKVDLFTSWRNDLLKFDNSPFDEVVKKMERWYGIKIILDKKLKYSENYTFTVKTESLKELLELLSITTPMSYKVDKDTVWIYQLNSGAMK